MSNELVGRVDQPENDAMRIPGITVTMANSPAEMGVKRSVQTLLTVNYADGSDRPASFTGRGVQWLRSVG